MYTEIRESFARRQHVFDIAATPIDVDSNFLSCPASVSLFPFRPKCNLLVMMIMSRKFNLLKSIQYYALEVCALDKRSVQSLDFTINRFFMKLFKTSSIVTVRDCQI